MSRFLEDMSFAELVFVQGLLGRWIDDHFRSRAVRWQGDGLGDYVAVWSRCLVGFGKAIRIQKEVFYAWDLRNFAGEELHSKPCAENLAVHSGMTSGLVELAVGIILELVPGAGISGSLSLISSSLASLSALAAVDPSLIFGQFFLLYTIEVFFFLCHGLFERCVLLSGLASRSSRMDVHTSVRVIGLVAYVQIDPLGITSLVAPGGRWKVLRRWLCAWRDCFVRILT
ncbi:hypothetical protein DY000_02040955 [Brassica cretica]|uniref:Uncharacterized protein n=1 Tax=Brassica cretica TaxID=69181 RepID=A0ABQ7BA91_BRACR|nr:hypothetical protein DY000_02040955 [Brassica cretica]